MSGIDPSKVGEYGVSGLESIVEKTLEV